MAILDLESYIAARFAFRGSTLRCFFHPSAHFGRTERKLMECAMSETESSLQIPAGGNESNDAFSLQGESTLRTVDVLCSVMANLDIFQNSRQLRICLSVHQFDSSLEELSSSLGGAGKPLRIPTDYGE